MHSYTHISSADLFQNLWHASVITNFTHSSFVLSLGKLEKKNPSIYGSNKKLKIFVKLFLKKFISKTCENILKHENYCTL